MKSIKRIFSVLCIAIAIPTALFAQGGGWTVNPYDFRYDMTVYAGLVQEGGMATDYTNYEVAAFVGDECRGVAEVQSQGDKTWLYMRIRSNADAGETVTFKLYDKAESKEYAVNESVTFESQASVGMPSAPTELHLIYNVSAKSANEDMGRVEMDVTGQVVGGSQQRLSAIPETGYVFVRWSQDDVPVSTENPYVFTVFKDASLVANFKLGRYNVTFDVDGVTSTESMLYGSVIPTPTEPSKEGHEFAGWEPEFKNGATVPANDITYVAQWTVNKYTITFDTDGGTAVAPITQDYGSPITPPTPPSKVGYKFNGWDEQIPATMPAEDKTLTAQWTVNKYTITFDTDGGTAVAPITQNYGTAITAPTPPTKEGHTFNGWSEKIPATMPAGDKTIKALWTVNKYTITFDTDGGTAVAPITQNYGTAITAPAAPSKEGHTFKGWSEQIPATMPAANKTITALWTVNKYEVLFKVDGAEYSKAVVEYGSEIKLPATPTKVGHTFVGWGEVPKTMPSKNIVLNAVFSINKYLVTFVLDGEVLSSASLQYGSRIEIPKVPGKEGHTFDGWGNVDETVPAHDVTYVGVYRVNVYKVFYYIGEKLVHTEEVEYGAEIPEYVYKPTVSGEVFNGWIGEQYDTMPAHDVRYIADIATSIRSLHEGTQGLVIYDLRGRRVKDTSILRGGVYVINGRKTLVK